MTTRTEDKKARMIYERAWWRFNFSCFFTERRESVLAMLTIKARGQPWFVFGFSFSYECFSCHRVTGHYGPVLFSIHKSEKGKFWNIILPYCGIILPA